ncbi:MAG: methylenetetrahydrofolate reductase C-terminal domain-containing protein [Candidatus Bathyarchaeia archaeon]
MIVTKMKPLEDVLSYVSEHKRILVVGCDGCTTPPRGWKEAKNLAIIIEMAGKLKGKNFECKPTTVTLQCDNYICATTLRPQIEGVDAVLSLACGVGVQTLVEVFPNLQIYPAQDTIFVGSQERENASLYEKCRACGECILAETGGLCPVTRCAKGIMNGPCGGMVDGKGEVGG